MGDGIIFSRDIAEAERLLKTEEGCRPLMILFEKNGIKSDLQKIEYLKTKFPCSYVVLVTDSIEKNEIPKYQIAGISDTIPTMVSEERLNNGIEFVERNQELIRAVSYRDNSLGIYKCPIWKRTFDILFSIASIILLSPLLIVTALAIVLESPGKIVYKSKRVGSNYTVFDFYKFRSMYKDADIRLKEFLTLNQYNDFGQIIGVDNDGEIADISKDGFDEVNFYVSDDAVITESKFIKEKRSKERNNFIKYENDPRITKVGKVIRKFSIDELPQLINVLKGDMSIVGNRPLPLYEAEQLTSDQYIDRFMGPSGLTGLWQVEKRGDSGKLSPEERKQLDVYYANNYSFIMDLKIILKTFTAFVQKENV
ncbi:MAG: sugar transferase [Bacteroidales bacterium]